MRRMFTEPIPVPDVFVHGLAQVEVLPYGNVRLTYYRERRSLYGTTREGGPNPSELEIVQCIVMPAAAIAEMRELYDAAIRQAKNPMSQWPDAHEAHPTVS